MTSGNPHGSTIGLSEQSAGALPTRSKGNQDEVAVPSLSVLFHPDCSRIGERALLGELLSRRSVKLSRLSPEFTTPGGRSGRPLATRYLSRRPVKLQAVRDSIRVDVRDSRTRVVAQGVFVDGRRDFPPPEIEDGVVLELGRRIVLLLHYFREPAGSNIPRFRLVGESDGIMRVRQAIHQVADLEVPVLVRGQSGTGKELVAQAIHKSSRRCDRNFVAVNLGSITPSLAAAELFGSVKGAYTGSTGNRDGYFRQAHGGTLFLDEIGEAPPEVQVMLLRVLETGSIRPLGSPSEQRVDVRIVAATDADLESQSQQGQFREPLIHRLAGYVIWLPCLSRRRDDIGRLLVHFLRRELEAMGEAERLDGAGSEPWLPPAVVARLARCKWTGNVRQLRNVVRQLVIGSRGLGRLRIDSHIERMLEPPGPGDAEGLTPERRLSSPTRIRYRQPGEVSDRELVKALDNCGWKVAAAARALGVSRTSLYSLIRACPLVRTAGDVDVEEIRQTHRACQGDLLAMTSHLHVSADALKSRLTKLGLPWSSRRIPFATGDPGA